MLPLIRLVCARTLARSAPRVRAWCVAAAVCLGAGRADADVPWFSADYTMRYTALSVGPITGHVATARAAASVRVVDGLRVGLVAPLAVARVPTTPCCDLGLGNLAVTAAYAATVGGAYRVRGAVTAGLATATEDGLAGATAELAASAHVIDAPEAFLPGAWSGAVSGDVARRHPFGWTAARAEFVHRRAFGSAATTVRLTNTAGIPLPRGLAASAALTTAAAVSAPPTGERFMHAVYLDGSYLASDLGFGLRVWIPLDASVRATSAGGVEIHASVAW